MTIDEAHTLVALMAIGAAGPGQVANQLLSGDEYKRYQLGREQNAGADFNAWRKSCFSLIAAIVADRKEQL